MNAQTTMVDATSTLFVRIQKAHFRVCANQVSWKMGKVAWVRNINSKNLVADVEIRPGLNEALVALHAQRS